MMKARIAGNYLLNARFNKKIPGGLQCGRKKINKTGKKGSQPGRASSFILPSLTDTT